MGLLSMEKKGVLWPYVIGIAVAILILIIGFAVFYLSNERGISFIDYLKNLIRFGR